MFTRLSRDIKLDWWSRLSSESSTISRWPSLSPVSYAFFYLSLSNYWPPRFVFSSKLITHGLHLFAYFCYTLKYVFQLFTLIWPSLIFWSSSDSPITYLFYSRLFGKISSKFYFSIANLFGLSNSSIIFLV